MGYLARVVRQASAMLRRAAFASIALALLTLASSGAAAGAEGCQFVGNVDYSYGGNTAVLTADQIENFDPAGVSGTLRMELWALTVPYTGTGGTGYKVAQYVIGQLPAGASLYNVSSGPVPFVLPPTGTWTFVLFLTEYAGLASDDGYGPTDWRNFTLTALAVEYYYGAWNFYFETAFLDEIAALDGGAFGGLWQRTGQTFSVWTQSDGVDSPTCRFFSTIFAPKSSHFYTPFPAECAIRKNDPGWQFESIAFYLQLADANGLCPAGTVALYRAYNNGMGGAPNHRYTTSTTILDQMIAAGWVFEGNGNTRVFACAAP